MSAVARFIPLRSVPGFVRRMRLICLVALCLSGCHEGRDHQDQHYALRTAWLEQNKQAYDQFTRLAREEGWEFFVRCEEESVGRFDFSLLAYQPIYLAPQGRSIWQTSSPRRGRIALTECRVGMKDGNPVCNDFQLVFLERDSPVVRVPVEDKTFGACEQSKSIALGNRWAFFVSMERGYLYDTQERRLQAVVDLPEQEKWGWRRKALLVEEKWLLLLVVHPGSGYMHMVVWDARKPHELMCNLEDIAGAIVVGQHIVVEKDGGCFLYDPSTRKQEQLTPGKLSIPWGPNEFLFYTPEWAALESGYARWGHERFQIYNLKARSAEFLWTAPRSSSGFGLHPEQQMSYDFDRLMVSPDRRFLFLPWRGYWSPKGGSYELVYGIYELKSGKNRGAFLEPYEKHRRLEFLGWAEGQGRAQ